jgi:hypothetical protein
MAMSVTNKTKVIAITAAVLAAGGALSSTLMASCAQTPTNVPVQTFEQPQNMDVVCLQVGQTGIYPNFTAIIPPIPQPQAQCAQVPAGINGSELPYHLFALVTQETRGEVAVVDLTSGYVIDVDPSTPGINFLPVGRLPSDIAATPDGTMVFVGSADPNSPSIFALPSVLVLGDSQEYDGGEINPDGTQPIPDLTTWPVCSLPQAPGAIRILPNNLLPPTGDGGATVTSPAGYVIVAVLPGDSNHTSKVVTIDPAPLLRGSAPYIDAGLPPGYQVDAGSLSPCQILQDIPLGAPAPGTTWTSGPPWDDGVKYVDGGADVDLPQPAVACASPTDAGALTGGSSPLLTTAGSTPSGGATVLDTSGPRPLLYVADTELPLIHVVDLSNPSAPVELSPLLATSLANPAQVVTVGQIAVSPTTRDYKRFLYAVDRVGGSIMVYDVTDPINGPKVPLVRPHAVLDPFQPPDRILFGSPVASVAFVQNDWPLTQKLSSPSTGSAGGFLEPLTTAETGLLCNPNPNVDQGSNASVAAAGYAYEQGPFADDGAYYRAASSSQTQTAQAALSSSALQIGLGPTRLRGIFAFATLTNGSVIAIDVDDWDAPCRRPDPLAPRGGILKVQPPLYGAAISQANLIADSIVDGPFSAVAPPEPSPSSPSDFDPYHTPVAFNVNYTDSPVTLEWFYPVSAPHRARSGFVLTNSTTNGNHAPYLLGVPQLYSAGAPLATQGTQAIGNPSLVPTDSPFVDPSVPTNPTEANPVLRTPSFTPAIDGGGPVPSDLLLVQSTPGATPGIRFAWEDPEVFVDQDWTVTYEGPLPGFFDNGGNPLIQTDVRAQNQDDNGNILDGGAGAAPDYSAVWLYNADGYFCSKGIEDVAAGAQRASADEQALQAAGLPEIPGLQSQIADYVQVWNPVRAPTDSYWTIDNACWAGVSSDPAERAQLCSNTYGLAPVPAAVGGQTASISDLSLQRDFPIIEAHDGQLLIGRFAYVGGQPVPREPGASNWTVVGPDPSNAPFLKLMQCCFGDQIWFNVRTGGQWSTVGSSNGFLHHIVATGSDARCAPSCEARDALLNGRAPPVPRPLVPGADAGAAAAATCSAGYVPSITRDSVLAMRNPLFSFLVWNGQNPTAACADSPPTRDMAWTFSTRGSFSPLLINIAGSTTNVSPQTMRFIDSLGQLAVIDGASQGLVLINLDTIAEAHAPYF